MKWLLVTGFDNPGDEWARLGIVRLIQSVDSCAEFESIDKLTERVLSPVEADRVVFCGQPLVWAHDRGTTLDICWWEPINTWMADIGLVLAGWGLFLNYESDCSTPIMINRDAVLEGIRNLLLKAKASYCRSSMVRIIGDGLHHAPCPSIFAGMDWDGARDMKVFSLMPGANHYPQLDPMRAECWEAREASVVKIMKDAGFVLAAHSRVELDMALQKYQWPDDRIFLYEYDPIDFLRHYGRCAKYFGNRIHGGIVSRSFGAEAVVCGYDTRMQAVEDVGGKTVFPEHLDLEWLADWANSPAEYRPMPIADLFEQQRAFYEH